MAEEQEKAQRDCCRRVGEMDCCRRDEEMDCCRRDGGTRCMNGMWKER